MPNTVNTTVYETAADLYNVHSVLKALETFAVTNGWTVMKSCLAEDIVDTPIAFDDSGQSGDIGAATSPWSSNFEGAYSITDSVITSAVDSGIYYRATIDGFSIGDSIEIEFEILTRTSGTLSLHYGAPNVSIVRYSTTERRVHKFIYEVESGTQVHFQSSDFIGSFKLLSIRKRVKNLELSLFRSGVGYFHFNSEISSVQDRVTHKGPFIYLCTSSGWEEGAEYNAHPGTSPISTSNNIDEYYHNNIFGYHFFGTDKHIYMIIEPWEGEFCHLGFGSIYKYWDFRGGNFVYGCKWAADSSANANADNFHYYPLGYYSRYGPTNYMRADLLGSTLNSYLMEADYTSYPYLYLWGTYNGFASQMYEENQYYGTAPLSPVHLGGADINYYRYPLGEMEEYRRTFCQFIDPKTVLSINQEDWMIFPVRRKQLVAPEEYISNSENYALAFYKGPTTP